MNIEYWYHFMETARQKSILKASAKLQMTHPALSKQIRALEQYYGVTLFRRSSTGVQLTEAGNCLFQRLEVLIAEHEMLRTDLQKYAATDPKPITLGTLPSIAMFHLPAKVLRLQANGFRMKVVVRHTTKELVELLQNDILHAVLIEKTPLHKSVWTTELFREVYYAILPTDHPLSCQSELSKKEMVQEPLVVHPNACVIRKTIVRQFERSGLVPQIGKEIDFGESILAYVAAGAGITIMPLSSTAEQVTDPRLKVIPLIDFDAERVIILATRSSLEGKHLLRYLK
ncbi:LysR family transcriptional regulator [Melghirimyces algeriensis]|uniref:DNA-binding transcriptional regulator, LysR family n=1 Tax=Melghirimyces algeriensis TaxID=910412 RepID=A0A521B1N1_9BACL|nr:LysR family transcriptional regulator [Melghirimyces algeriensis]SMO41013.1 DNA-binding transcriptional regulator, LysR family [Melghirimyces algeriensis]